jgi:hypothetical protein
MIKEYAAVLQECLGLLNWFMLVFTQLLTEMSIRSRKLMFLGSTLRLVRRADNLTAI